MAQKLRPQAETLSGSPQPNFTGYATSPIVARRAPTTSDKGYPIGQIWINKLTNIAYALTSVGAGAAIWTTISSGSSEVDTITGDTGGPLSPVAGNINVVGSNTVTTSGSGSTLTITSSNNGYPITPYVVGPTGKAGYSSIQAAVNAAASAGGGIVYIQPGTYNENVTMGIGVDLLGIVGTSGNMVLTVDGGEIPSVVINGNFVLDVTAAVAVPTTVISNIMFTATSGNVFRYIGNSGLLESGYLTFRNCLLQAGTGSNAVFYIDGFMNLNFESCVINEATANTTTFSVFGVVSFVNFSSRNSVIDINSENAWVIPAGSFITWAVENTAYSARIDLTTGVSSLSFNSTNSFFNFDGGTPGDALIEFAANDGSVVVQNCIIGTCSGSLANSTTVDANSVFRYTSCVFNNALVIGATGRGDFTYCKFFGGSSAAITMSSSQAVSFIDCVFNSSNNPCIDGVGAGTITFGDVTFLDNTTIAGTLTSAWEATKLGALTVTGAVTTSGGAVAINSGTNALGISTDASATTMSIGTGGAVKTISVGGTSANVIAIANTQTAGSLAIGNAMTTGTVTIGGATNAGTFTFGASTAAGGQTINIGSASNGGTQSINIGNGASAADSSVNILSGSGSAGAGTLALGNNARVTTIGIGNVAPAAARITTMLGGNSAQSDTLTILGGAPSAGTQTINMFSGNATGGTQVFNLFTGTNAGAINIGTGTTGVKTIAVGGTAANVITIGNTQTAGSVAIGAAMTTGTITIGGSGLQTGTITLGGGTGAQIVNVATGGTGIKTVHIADSAIDNIVTIGSTTGTAATTINSGSGNLTLVGNVLKTTNPAFLAYLAATKTDKTGNGTAYTLGTDALTKVYDRGNNFNTNGTFTAPVTGIYDLRSQVTVTGTTIATTFVISIVSTARTYTYKFVKAAGAEDETVSVSALADMTATDTAHVTITVSGEAGNTDDILGAASAVTYFCGSLVA